jgi:hypothetical protein
MNTFFAAKIKRFEKYFFSPPQHKSITNILKKLGSIYLTSKFNSVFSSIKQGQKKKRILSLTGIQDILEVSKDPQYLSSLPGEKAIDVAWPRDVGRNVDFKRTIFE